MNREALIEKYLEGTLSPEERKEFDLLLQDEAFQKEVAFHTDLKKVAEFEDDAQFKQQLKEYESESGINRNRFLRWIAAASAVAAIGLTWWLGNNTSNNEALFGQYFEPYRNIVAPLVRGEKATDTKTKAFLAYENGNFEDAITLFLDLLSNEANSDYQFYLANAYLATDNPELAIPLLSDPEIRESLVPDKIDWYLALAYLRSDNIEQAREHFAICVAIEGYNAEQARKILETLK